jgi:hypothetical protein
MGQLWVGLTPNPTILHPRLLEVDSNFSIFLLTIPLIYAMRFFYTKIVGDWYKKFWFVQGGTLMAKKPFTVSFFPRFYLTACHLLSCMQPFKMATFLTV